MRLTTKGRFAVTAMVDLALRQQGHGQGPITLATISKRQKISLSYLEQLFGKLRRHGLVSSTRGPGGGYKLARRAVDITVADIIVSVDEPIDSTQCGGKADCNDGKPCITHNLWSDLNRHIVDFLDSINLQQLVENHYKIDSFGKRVKPKNTPDLISLEVKAPNSVFNLANIIDK